MADVVSKQVRSNMMAAVKSRNTMPEKLVRSKLYKEGFRFRLHHSGLPGTPDIVLPRYKTVVFVNGCFWHGHDCSKGRNIPKTHTEFWRAKLDRNNLRDRQNHRALRMDGWRVFVVWTCQIESDSELVLDYLRSKRLTYSLSDHQQSSDTTQKSSVGQIEYLQ